MGKYDDDFGNWNSNIDMDPLIQEEKQKSWKKLIKVAISGAAGMISNHLLFMVLFVNIKT